MMKRTFLSLFLLLAATGGLLAGPPAGAAPVETELTIKSASIDAIAKSLSLRYSLLTEHFESGQIGFTHDGLIALREPGALPQAMRAALELLVSEDNKDRGTMYREIAHQRPADWESNLRACLPSAGSAAHHTAGITGIGRPLGQEALTWRVPRHGVIVFVAGCAAPELENCP
jgi:hypothetical protein